MSIQKNIFQTFKTKKLPLLTRFHIWKIKKLNPDYSYHLYDDDDIDKFLQEEFPPQYFEAYKRLTIGAAKADFFRYAILYKKGGVYLDIDSSMSKPLKALIKPDDVAILSRERHPQFFVQWALIYEKGHPFLAKVLEHIVDNIENHRYPNDIHKTTGPTAYTKGIEASLRENPETLYRVFDGIEFRGYLKFKYKLGKFFLYSSKAEHWKQKQLTMDIIDPRMVNV